jgi:hypothetical protein
MISELLLSGGRDRRRSGDLTLFRPAIANLHSQVAPLKQVRIRLIPASRGTSLYLAARVQSPLRIVVSMCTVNLRKPFRLHLVVPYADTCMPPICGDESGYQKHAPSRWSAPENPRWDAPVFDSGSSAVDDSFANLRSARGGRR